ncbi:MAG: hypothetical protein GX676_04910 [Bacilli bacterium]|nr:hypothetical protein [Bacilli bacterium]
MNPAVYSVIRDGYWDLSKLDDIEKQVHLLNIYQKLMLIILLSGIKVAKFHFHNRFLYDFTSLTQKNKDADLHSMNYEEVINTEKRFNYRIGNDLYLTVIKAFDDIMILEHYQEFTSDEIKKLKFYEEVTQNITIYRNKKM